MNEPPPVEADYLKKARWMIGQRELFKLRLAASGQGYNYARTIGPYMRTIRQRMIAGGLPAGTAYYLIGHEEMAKGTDPGVILLFSIALVELVEEDFLAGSSGPGELVDF